MSKQITVTILIPDAKVLSDALVRAAERDSEYADPSYGFGASDADLERHRKCAEALTRLCEEITLAMALKGGRK